MSSPTSVLRKDSTSAGASSTSSERSNATRPAALKGSEGSGFEAQEKALRPGEDHKGGNEAAGGTGGGAAAQPIPDVIGDLHEGAKRKSSAQGGAQAGGEGAATKTESAALAEHAGPSKGGGAAAPDFVKKADDMLKRSVDHAKTAAGSAKEVAVSKPGDAQEKEADHVAEVVTKGAGAEAKLGAPQGPAGGEHKGAALAAASTSKAGVAAGVTGAVCAECGGAMISKSKGAAPTCSTCGKSGAAASSTPTPAFKGVARKATSAGASIGSVARGAEGTVPGGSGKPVDQGMRGKVEAATGADLSGVRVHEGEEAQGMASRFGAKAYTSGQDVVVGKGQSSADTGLMAHELAHAAQQQRGGGPQVSRLSLDDVIPDSILNWFRGASGQAQSLGGGLTSASQSAATSAQTEASGVPGQAQGTADSGVAAAQQQGESASSQAAGEQSAAQGEASQASAQAETQAAGMQAAGPAASYASDPVRPLVEPAPAGGMAAGAASPIAAPTPVAAGGGAAAAGGGVAAPTTSGGGGAAAAGGGVAAPTTSGGGGAAAAGGGVAAPTPAGPAGGGGAAAAGGGVAAPTTSGGGAAAAGGGVAAPTTSGGGAAAAGGGVAAPTTSGGGAGGAAPGGAQAQAPQTPQQGGGAGAGGPAAPNAAGEVAGAAGGAARPAGSWNCDSASIVAKVTSVGQGIVAGLTQAVKAVVPEEVLQFAQNGIAAAQRAITTVRNKVGEVKNRVVNWVDQKTQPIRQRVTQITERVSAAYETAKGFARQKIDAAKTWASNKWEGLKTTVATAVDNAIARAKSGASNLLASARSMAGRFWSMVPAWLKRPIEGAVSTVEGMIGAARQGINNARDFISQKATAFTTWAQSKADGAVQWFATKYNTVKSAAVQVGTAISNTVTSAKNKAVQYGQAAYNAVDNATGGRITKWREAASQKFNELKGAACGVAGDIAGPCIEKALPDPGKDGKTQVSFATNAEVTVPVYGVPVKVAAGSTVAIEREGTKYRAILTGEGSLGVSIALSGGGGGGGGGGGVSATMEGSLPNKARAMMGLNGGVGLPGGLSVPIGGGAAPGGAPAGGAPAAAPGGAPAGGAPAAAPAGGAPAPAGGGQQAPAGQGGQQQGGAPGGGGGAKVSAEAGKKLKVEATYEFDGSASAQNTCDGLGGLAAFVGAHGASHILPQPFSAMASAGANAAFGNNLKSVKATWADTGKIAAEAELGGVGKVSGEVNMESGVTVGMERKERKSGGQVINGPDGKPIRDTVLSAKLYRTLGGQLAGEFCPGGLAILKGAGAVSGTGEVNISYNMGTDQVDADMKLGVTASATLSGFPGVLNTLPAAARGPIQARLAQRGISPDTHEGQISMECAAQLSNLRELAIAIDAELSKGEGATAAGIWTAVKNYVKTKFSLVFSAKAVFTEKILGAGVKADDGKGLGGGVSVSIGRTTEFKLCDDIALVGTAPE